MKRRQMAVAEHTSEHLVEKLRELHARVAHKEDNDIENLRQVLAKTLAVLIAEFGHRDAG
jgi:hypothetical protein